MDTFGLLLHGLSVAMDPMILFYALVGVTLVPSTGGAFLITIDGVTIWERKADGGFPGAAELKRRVRDVIEPERDLGHADRAQMDS